MSAEPRLLFVHSSIDDAGLSPGAMRVLVHFARRANKKGEAWPSIRAIARTCRMNCHSVINAIRELEQIGFVIADRSSGRSTVYRLFPSLEETSDEPSKTTQAETQSVAYVGNGEETQGVAHLGNRVLPTQATGCCLTKSADLVPEPLELPEGIPIRLSNKVLHSSAGALTPSPSYQKEKEVTEKETDSTHLSRSNPEPRDNLSKPVTKSETKNKPSRKPTRDRIRPGIPGARPESEAEVILFITSLGFPKEDGEWLWAHWQGNGFKNNGEPMHDWRATIRSWAQRGYLPSQKAQAARAAKKGIGRNII